MNLNINSQMLAAELRLLNKIVPSKPAVAILSYVLLRAEENKLTFYASDLEVGLVSEVEADVREPGVLALPAQKLLSLIEQFPDDDVQITRDKTQVVVRCGKFTSRLQVLPPDDFPAQPKIVGTESKLSGLPLAQAIGKTRYAVSASGPKYVIQGALFTLKQNGAALVATDGKRLAIATMKLDQQNEPVEVVIPTKTLDVLSSQLANTDVTMILGERHLFFRIDHRLIISRMIDGKFPAYEKIIPRQNDKQISMSRPQFAAILRRVNLVSDENQAVIFDVRDNMMKISSSSVEVGSADEAIEVDYNGPPMKVCVNGDYVLDFANTATYPNVVIQLKDTKTALMLLDGTDYIGVVMPMKMS